MSPLSPVSTGWATSSKGMGEAAPQHGVDGEALPGSAHAPDSSLGGHLAWGCSHFLLRKSRVITGSGPSEALRKQKCGQGGALWGFKGELWLPAGHPLL